MVTLRMKVGFYGDIKLEFHGAKLSSNSGLLAYRNLDHTLGLFDSVSASFIDERTGRIFLHAMPTLLRQSIYRRLAGYEDVNNVGRSPEKMTMASKQPALTRRDVLKLIY